MEELEKEKRKFQMKEKVEYYLEHQDARQAIASTGQKRIRELLDSRDCFYEMIESIESGQMPGYKTTKPSSLLEIVDGWYRGLDYLRSVGRRFKPRQGC